MLRKRIIFTLIYDNGFFNQSRNFRLQKVGDIKWLENYYNFKKLAFSFDELIVLNASRKDKNILEFAKILNRLVDNVFIPIAAGGGIRSLEDAKILFNNGADKIVLNTAIYTNKNLVEQLIIKYGTQSVVASVDYKKVGKELKVFIENGTYEIDMDLFNYIQYIENLGVGEIYLNSIDRDGTGFGYDIETIKKIAKIVSIPLIIVGGAGNEKHLEEGLKIENVNAVATANLFNFIGDGLPNARKKLLEKNINLARWE